MASTKLIPTDSKSIKMFESLEKGVFDGLNKSVLKKIFFTVEKDQYEFTFTYSEMQDEVLMQVASNGGSFSYTSSSPSKLVCVVLHLMNIMDKTEALIPHEVSIKLDYYYGGGCAGTGTGTGTGTASKPPGYELPNFKVEETVITLEVTKTIQDGVVELSCNNLVNQTHTERNEMDELKIRLKSCENRLQRLEALHRVHFFSSFPNSPVEGVRRFFGDKGYQDLRKETTNTLLARSVRRLGVRKGVCLYEDLDKMGSHTLFDQSFYGDKPYYVEYRNRVGARLGGAVGHVTRRVLTASGDYARACDYEDLEKMASNIQP